MLSNMISVQFLFDLINKFLPIRELFNVVEIAIKSAHQHFVILTAEHWYMLILFIFLFFSLALAIFVYFQNYYKYSILKHIKLRHNWILYETPEYPKYCTNCSGIIRKRFLLMRSYEGWQCLICKRVSHMHCIMQSDSQFCKMECSLGYISQNDSDYLLNSSLNKTKNDKKSSKQDNIHYHILIKGNLQSGAVCSICKTVCFSPFGLHGQRCIWCNRTFHDECALNRKISEQSCDFGSLKYIILPPNSFKIELMKSNENYDCASNKISLLDKNFKKNFTYDNSTFTNSKIQIEYIENKNVKFNNFKSRVPSHRRRISELIQIFPKSKTFKKKIKLVEDFLIFKTIKPILVFINVKSGGHLGQELIKDLYIYLNPIQIIDIQNSKGPDEALLMFKELADANRLIILVCGGDGTVRWVLDRSREIYGADPEKLPPIAILPLGTGNDLSRILGWDVSFNGDILSFLKRICTSNIKKMDIWTCSAWEIDKTRIKNKSLLFSSNFLNYLDIGIAARIALKFHNLREAYPQHFNSRLGNQLVYGEVGLRDFFSSKSVQLDGLKIWCDGEEVNILNKIGNNQIVNHDNSISCKSSKSCSFEKIKVKNCVKYLICNKIHNFICKYIYSIFMFLYRLFGVKKSLCSEIEEREFTETLNHASKEQKLEGLIICNIPSFAGGINLWKINQVHQLRASPKKSSNSIRRTVTLTNKTVCKNSNERSMSFTVENIRNTNYAPCPYSDSSESDEINFFENGFSNERKKYTNTLRHWFSNVFKKNLPVISNSEDIKGSEKNYLNSSFKSQRIDDGLIEVCGIRSLFHLTQLQVGLTEPIKICQGSHIVVDIPRQVPFQVDGEPRIINKCQLTVESSGKIPVLCPQNDNIVPLSVQNALELAVQKKVVDNKQRIWITKQIMKENKILIS